MPPRKNNPADTSERQADYRQRRADEGLVRREFYLSQEVLEDEAYVRERMGAARVRMLIGWALAKQRAELDGQQGTHDGHGSEGTKT